MPSPVLSNRQEERLPINRSVEFTVQRCANNYFEGTALDYSPSGMRLATNRLLLTGDRITVFWGQRKLTGRVVYCLAQGPGFSVGVHVTGR